MAGNNRKKTPQTQDKRLLKPEGAVQAFDRLLPTGAPVSGQGKRLLGAISAHADTTAPLLVSLMDTALEQ